MHWHLQWIILLYTSFSVLNGLCGFVFNAEKLFFCIFTNYKIRSANTKKYKKFNKLLFYLCGHDKNKNRYFIFWKKSNTFHRNRRWKHLYQAMCGGHLINSMYRNDTWYTYMSAYSHAIMLICHNVHDAITIVALSLSLLV